jgi:putative aldouronate transport system permease protein
MAKNKKNDDFMANVRLTPADKVFYACLDIFLVLVLIAVIIPLWSTITTAFRPMSYVGTNVEHMGETDLHIATVDLRTAVDNQISLLPAKTDETDADAEEAEVPADFDEEAVVLAQSINDTLKLQNMTKSLNRLTGVLKSTKDVNATASKLAALTEKRNVLVDKVWDIKVKADAAETENPKLAKKLYKDASKLEKNEFKYNDKIQILDKSLSKINANLSTSSAQVFGVFENTDALQLDSLKSEIAALSADLEAGEKLDDAFVSKLNADMADAKKALASYVSANSSKQLSEKMLTKNMAALTKALTDNSKISEQVLTELSDNIELTLALDTSMNIGPGLRGMFLLPWHWSVDAFRALLGNNGFLTAFRNSFIILIFGVFIALLMTIPIASTLSVKNLPGLKFLNVFILIPYLFNTGMIPMYLVIVKMGMINHIASVFVPGAIGAYNVLIMRGFFEGIPEELKESARIDGASEVYVLWKIILPLSKPIIMTIGLYYGVSFWNDFMHAMLYLNNNNLQPLPILLRNILLGISMGENVDVNAFGNAPIEAIKAASVFMSAIPMIVAYPFIQKYFTKGTLAGSVKG